MKNILFFILLMTMPLYGQVKFSEGTYIDNKDNLHQVLIKDFDWLNSPSEIIVKIENTEKTLPIKEIKEFSVNDKKYIRYTGDLEISSKKINYISKEPNFIFENRTVFLKEEYNGEVKLYSYKSDDFNNYFYSINNSPLELLSYKRYYIPSSAKTVNKNTYQNTLSKNFSCGNLRYVVNYSTDELVRFFDKYSSCKNLVRKDFKDKKIRNTKNFTITAGITMNTPDFSIDARDFSTTTNSGSSFGATLGLEYFLPINNNKWSLNADLNYINIESSASRYNNNVYIKFSEIQVLLNARHYMYINDGSRFFVSAGLNTSIINPVLKEDFIQNYANYSDSYTKNITANFVFGVGYKYNNLGFDVRYSSNNGFIDGHNLKASYKLLSLRLTYDIFKF